MKRRPFVLVSPDTEAKGAEFGDRSTSLAETYQRALIEAGTLPFALPASIDRKVIADCVARADGILLTGGEDIEPGIYEDGTPAHLRKKVTLTPDGGRRDLREMILVDETVRQRKPLLAICRGHQVLNVALGGTLYADISTELPQAIQHRRMDQRARIVHEVRLTAGSLLAKIAAKPKMGVNSTHHQAVRLVAPPLWPSAVCSDGVIEGLELRPEAAGMLPFLLSVQFHPERLADRYAEHRRIFRTFAKACGQTA